MSVIYHLAADRASSAWPHSAKQRRKLSPMSEVAIARRKELSKVQVDSSRPLNREPIKDKNKLDPHKNYAYIPAEDAFKMYATHGLSLDIIRDLAHEKGMLVDEVGFELFMEEHRNISRPPGKHLGLRGTK